MTARKTARPLALLTLAALACLCQSGIAQAQWQWRDASGRTVFSDVPPPPSVPPASVVKAPGRFAGALRPAEPAPAVAAVAAMSVNARTELKGEAKAEARPAASAEDAFQKRRADALKAEAEQATRDKLAQERQVRCTEMRNFATALQQNRRIALPAADGSAQHLNDDQRQAEMQRANASIAENCA